MTISLAIDTSTSRTSVAIVDDGALLWHGYRDGATAHGGALSILVSQALAVQLTIDRVVVGMGPGPFTGLRVGIAFAITFGQAREVPVFGVCSLDTIAATVTEQTDFIIATDARRKEIYWARYSNGLRVDGPHVDVPSLLDDERPIYGEGAIKYGLASSDENQFPDLVALVEISMDSARRVNEAMYLRRPDAQPTSERSPA